MEKLKKYNQWLLAIIGSLVTIFITGALIVSTVDLLDGIFDDEYEPPASVIIDSEGKDSERTSIKRNQILNYGVPQLLDSALNLYAIPISQNTLEESEGIYGMLNIAGGSSKRIYRYDYYSINNIIVYNSDTDKKNKVFDVKVGIIEYNYLEKNKTNYLIIKAAINDTNKDNRLNSEDFQELFLFNLDLNKIQKIELGENTSYVDLYHLQNMDELIVRYYLDIDKNSTIETNIDPSQLKKISFENGIQVVDFIDDELNTQLQQILDN